MSPLISIQNLSRNYGDFRAVNDVSFELQAGEILGFLGPNGAGKSTTMRIISGALAPNSGQVMLNGIDLLKHPLDAKAQLGYLPENPPLHHELTVDEYLLFSGRLRAIPKQDMDKALSRVKEQCGLNEVGGRLIGQLSKGFQQRVGIAQAIIHDPRVVILDEPTNGLDPNQILDIRNLIHNLGQERGVILSTHILSEVQAICSRALILHRGKLAHEQTLNRQQAGELLHLELDTPPQPGELEKLQGVSKVIPLNPHRFKMQLSPGTECSSITEQAVNKGWGVRELSPAGHDLEQVFTRITSLENGA